MTDCTPHKATTPQEDTQGSNEHEIAEEESRETKQWAYRPDVDILEEPEAYGILADVPGADRELIDVTVEDGILSIEAGVKARYPEKEAEFSNREFGVGNYYRRFRISDDVDVEQIGAEYDLGVLNVTLPKRQTAQRRRIEIKST